MKEDNNFELRKENFQLKQKNQILEKQIKELKEIIKKLIALYFHPVVTKGDVKRQDEILNEAKQVIKE